MKKLLMISLLLCTVYIAKAQEPAMTLEQGKADEAKANATKQSGKLKKDASASATTPKSIFGGKFTITVDISKVKPRPAFIYHYYRGMVNGVMEEHYDSVKVKSDKVVFKGMIDEPLSSIISELGMHIQPEERNFMRYYLEPGNLKITCVDSLSNYKITGGKYSKDYAAFTSREDYYQKLFYPYFGKFQTLDPVKDSIERKRLGDEYEVLFNKWTKVESRQFILDHPASPVSLMPLGLYIGFMIDDPDDATKVFNFMAASVKKLPSAQKQKRLIDIARTTSIGKTAPIFSQPDTKGKIVKLTDFRGKYVLVDFWATWCGPCRAENPNLIANFEKYKNKNFTILQISMDEVKAKQAWLKAIEKDDVGRWSQVSSLQGFESEPGKLYGITAIPMNFLVDPNGKIVAKNLRGEDLNKKLEELLK